MMFMIFLVDICTLFLYNKTKPYWLSFEIWLQASISLSKGDNVH